MSDAEKLAKVRDLHRPVIAKPGSPFPECRGCDGGAFAPDWPDWPCATAEIVYSDEEQAAWQPFALVLHPNPAPEPSGLGAIIADLYEKEVRATAAAIFTGPLSAAEPADAGPASTEP